MDENSLTVVGIDVAKRTLEVALPGKKSLEIKNNTKEITNLLKKLPEAGQALIVLEATGGYENLLVGELLVAGYHVARVNPRQVRRFAQALGILAKTDRIDAAVITRFGEQIRPRTLSPLSQPHVELQQLVLRRRQLVDLRTMESNRLEQVTAKPAIKSIRKVLKVIESQIAELDEEIAQRIDSDEQWKNQAALLSSVPGVGTVTAATLITDLPELGELNRQEIAALAGLAPFNRDSGKQRGKRSIFGGRARVRAVIYMAAVTAMRWNPALREFNQRLESQGKLFKVRVTACMRKLLVILNTIKKTQTPWQSPHERAHPAVG